MTAAGVYLSIAIVISVVALRTLLDSRKKRLGAPFPPGPAPHFLLGNSRQIPHAGEMAWKVYAEMKQAYGNMIHLSALGRHIVVLNSFTLAKEMLEKRAVVYSGRPTLPMLGQLIGFEKGIGISQYGPDWRERRKMVHQTTHKAAMVNFWPDLTSGAHHFLRQTLQAPGEFQSHIRFSIGSFLLRSTYGLNVTSADDKYLLAAEQSIQAFDQSSFGTYIVDFIPSLKHIPYWFPFFKFQKHAKIWREARENMMNEPFNFVKSQQNSEAPQVQTIAGNFLSGTHNEDNVKYACGSLFTAGVDTTLITLKTLVYSLMMHPEIQARAQAEIDSVIGPVEDAQRLPTFHDRDSLPYINALIKEALRWHVAVPLGVSHSALEDDVFQGFFIPKNTIIQPNQWAMSRDPEYYDNPEEFRPERHLGENPALDPYLYVFGFGRRTCVGMHFADAVVFVVASSIIAAFNVTTSKDSDGNPILPQLKEAHAGFGFNFKCTMEPRSSQMATLISNSESF